jgi:hypothetical protein
MRYTVAIVEQSRRSIIWGALSDQEEVGEIAGARDVAW